MEKNRKRALRRYHNARKLQEAKRVIRAIYYWSAEDADPKEIYSFARRRRDNLQICSCNSCGNQRRSVWLPRRERLTLAERRNEDAFNDQLYEYLTLDPSCTHE